MASRVVISMCLGLLVAGVAGCVVSPQPSPPMEPPTLDGGLIGLRSSEALLDTDFVGFEGGPGAVDPPEGVVIVTNLDAGDAPSIASVAKDGSFAIAVPGHPGQRFRFQAKRESARSEPFDTVVSSSGQVVDDLAAAVACLAVKPARWVALDDRTDARSIVLRNTCSGAVAIDAPRLRRGLAGFSFSPTSPIGLAAGEVATLTVHGGEGAELEDVLILDVAAPSAEIRAITLTVPDP
jgi:hypothetical protein